MLTNLQKAKSYLQDSGASCVMAKDSELRHSEKPGIMPLLEWLKEDSTTLQNSSIADKVVGKAAALLMVFGKVSEVYAEVISTAAIECFEKNKVLFSFGEKVPYILNRDQTDMCPMEKRCMGTDSPTEAYQILGEMVKNFAKKP